MSRRVGFTEPDAWTGGYSELELVEPSPHATLRVVFTAAYAATEAVRLLTAAVRIRPAGR